MNKIQLEELLERVEKAEGPEDISTLYLSRMMSVLHVSPVTHDRIIQLWRIGAYESAAIALTEAVLPGWGRDHSNVSGPDGLWEVCMYSPDYNDSTGEHLGVGVHKSEPLAPIAATLKALIAETEE